MGFFADRKAKKEAKKAARKKKSLKEYARSKVFGNVMSDEDFDKFCKTAEAERAQREKNDNQGYFVYTADYGYSSGVMIKNSEVCQYFESVFEIREWVRLSLLGNNNFGGYSYNPHKILRFLPIISEFVDGNKMRRILRITDASGREHFNAAKRTITNEMESLLKSLP